MVGKATCRVKVMLTREICRPSPVVMVDILKAREVLMVRYVHFDSKFTQHYSVNPGPAELRYTLPLQTV